MHSQQPPGVVQNWSTLQCSKQNNAQCGYDNAPVTRGRMRAQFPLPHGPTPEVAVLKVGYFFWFRQVTTPAPPPLKNGIRGVPAALLTPGKPVGMSDARIQVACPGHGRQSLF